MAKPEWGLKRTCQGCGVRFYDLQRDPIVCPSCGAKFDPQAVSKPRRSRAAAVAAAAATAAPKKAAVVKNDALEDDEVETEDLDTLDDDDDDDEEVIEDASELGEDDIEVDVESVKKDDD